MPFPQGHGPFIHPAGLSAPPDPPPQPSATGFQGSGPSFPAGLRAGCPPDPGHSGSLHGTRAGGRAGRGGPVTGPRLLPEAQGAACPSHAHPTSEVAVGLTRGARGSSVRSPPPEPTLMRACHAVPVRGRRPL